MTLSRFVRESCQKYNKVNYKKKMKEGKNI